jgi:rubrerythrin
MVTTVGKEKDLVDLLKSLVELEYDARDAYQTAIDRIENASDLADLNDMRRDHLRHIAELSTALEDLGVKPPSGGDLKAILTKGKVVLGALFGDRAILFAMKTNEDDTNTAYERAAARELAPPYGDLMNRFLADERRHRAWLEARIATYGEPHPQGTSERGTWVEIFDRFTKDHRGWHASVEVLGEDVGAQIAEPEAPFEGISADLKSPSGDSIIILLGSEPGAHRDHIIHRPVHIRLRNERGGMTMQIETEDRRFILLRVFPARELPDAAGR